MLMQTPSKVQTNPKPGQNMPQSRGQQGRDQQCEASNEMIGVQHGAASTYKVYVHSVQGLDYVHILYLYSLNRFSPGHRNRHSASANFCAQTLVDFSVDKNESGKIKIKKNKKQDNTEHTTGT